jgi:monoamine oxidase
LPAWKQEAIAALPLGNHNRIALVFDRNVFGEDHPRSATIMTSGTEPMTFRIRPFGQDYVHGMTGGRFADWLERAGPEAAADFAKEKLRQAFGSDITRHIVRHLVTAWRGDPLIKGAYSAALPGRSDQREELARPIDERLYFAGEATTTDFFATAHGAYLTGVAAADAAADALA